jgi:hypothetical protein
MAEQRYIRHAIHPEHPDWRWRGTVARDDGRYQQRSWPGPTVEHVIREMDRELGAVPEAAYRVDG